LTSLGKAAGVKLWPLLRCPRWTVGWEIDIGHRWRMLLVVVEMTAQSGATKDSLDKLVLAQRFGEIVLLIVSVSAAV
jgi:hypothetical protein